MFRPSLPRHLSRTGTPARNGRHPPCGIEFLFRWGAGSSKTWQRRVYVALGDGRASTVVNIALFGGMLNGVRWL